MLVESSIVKNIDDHTVERLRSLGEHTKFNVTSNLFYEGQTPVVAYLIVNGTIHLTKNKKVKKTLAAKTLIGVKELMLHKEISFGAKVIAGTEICFLSKSDILELINNKDELAEKMYQLIAV